MNALDRRSFLQGALAQVGAGAVASLVGCRGGDEPACELVEDADQDWARLDPEGRIEKLLDAYFGRARREIREIGRAWRETADRPRPAISDFTCLHIEGSRNLTEALDSVHEALRADFDDWNTVTLHGWVLAETELLLCALASL